MLDLSAVTLLCLDSRSPQLAVRAMQRCLEQARFAKAVLLTDKSKLPKLTSDIEYIQCPKMSSTRDYSEVLLRGISSHINGSHVLLVQWDGFILDANQWDPCFLDYDYIGAVWPQYPNHQVGNGGFSLRSVRLLDALQDERIVISHPEDLCICDRNRLLLEDELGMKFAPIEIADRFSVERGQWHSSFGFHGFFNFSHALPPEEVNDFIREIPSDCCGGIDSYDLIDALRLHGNPAAARALFNKCQWRPKTTKRFIKTWMRSKITGF